MCGNKIGNRIQGNSLQTSKPVTGSTTGSFKGLDVRLVSSEKSILSETLLLDRIDLGRPASIDFSELDIRVLEQYSDPEDHRPALAALHVSKYAERLGNLEDQLLQASPGLNDLRSMRTELDTIELQALEDPHLGAGSNDRLAITGYLDEVKELLFSCLETCESMAGVREELAGEKPGYTVLQNYLQGIERKMENDPALDLEMGRYRTPLHDQLTVLGRVVSRCSGYSDRLAVIRQRLTAKQPDFKALSLGLQELTHAIEEDRGLALDSGVYRVPLQRLAAETGRELHRARLKLVQQLIEQHIPVLKKSSLSNQLSRECMTAFLKLHEHGFLGNTAFLHRLNFFVTGSLSSRESRTTVQGSSSEPVFTDKDIEDAFALANRNFPALAKGDPDTVDMLLKGPQWDTFSLKMKLSLDPEADREKVEVRHLCTIAKREFASHLQLATGRFKRDQGVESDFHDIRFDDRFIEGLLANPNLCYQKIDLMLANVLILEARVANRLDPADRQSVKKFSKKLKKLGFNDSLENIQKHISQDFQSSGQVRKAARAVEEFARSLSRNKLAFTVFSRACQQAPQVRAGKMLDILLRNFSGVQTENIIRLADIQELIGRKNIHQIIGVASDSFEIKKLNQAKSDIQKLNSLIAASRMESGRAMIALVPVREKQKQCLATLLDVGQKNLHDPRGVDSSQLLLSVFTDFQTLNPVKPDSRLLIRIRKNLLKGLKKFRLETMHTGGSRGEATEKYRLLLKKLAKTEDTGSVQPIITSIMELFTENRVQEKAQAIVDLRGTQEIEGLVDQGKRLEKVIGSEQSSQEKSIHKLHKLLTRAHARLVRQTLQAVVLNEFIGSGTKNWQDFTLDSKRITSIMTTQLGVPEYTFSGELSVISDPESNGNLLQVWEQEIALDSSLVRESKKVLKRAPEQHLEIIRQDKWQTMVTSRLEGMDQGQDFSLGFGKSLTLSSGEIPLGGPLDLEVSLTMARDNSLTVSRTGHGFEVLIKGGKSAGNNVNLSSFLNSVDVGVSGEVGRAKGCLLSFTGQEVCQQFLSGLMSGRAPVSSWIQADKVLMVRETSLGGGVTATVALPDLVPEPVSNVLGQQGMGVNISLEGEVSGQVQWTTKESASRLIRSTETSFSLSITGSLGLDSELLDQETTISVSSRVTVRKSSEMVYQYGVITADSSITRSFKTGTKPLHTLLFLLNKNKLSFPENDPRRMAVIELASQAGPEDSFEIIWRLKPDIALHIAELQFVGKHGEADILLRDSASFQPDQLVLVCEESVSLEQSRSFKSIEVIDFAESGTVNRLGIGLGVDNL
jgi:hypothetical protein